MSPPEAGDICETCRERWEARNQPPKRLVALPTLTEVGLNVVVCPYCDGTPILQFASNPDNKKLDPESEEE